MENTPSTASFCDRLEMPEGKSKRFVFARKLTAESNEYVFDPTASSEDNTLHEAILIKRVTMGTDATDPTEWNMIEMETVVDTMKVESFPVAYLRGTDLLQASLDLMISSTAKLTLAKGSGPVYIIGEYMTWYEEDEDYASEEAEEDDIDEEVEEDGLKDELNDTVPEDVIDTSSASKENKPPVVLVAKRKLDVKDESTIKKPKISVEEIEETKEMEGVESTESVKAPA